MPIQKKFSKATAENIKEKVPREKGIYELRNFGEVVCVGRSTDLRRRLLTHLKERNPNKYRYKTVGLSSSIRSVEHRHHQRHVEKHGSPPAWNDEEL
jgi:excinuclease UvrABC nuclease subunit